MKSQFDLYMENRERLAETYNGKIIAVKDGQFLGEYETWEEAQADMARQYEPETFVVVRCANQAAYDQEKIFYNCLCALFTLGMVCFNWKFKSPFWAFTSLALGVGSLFLAGWKNRSQRGWLFLVMSFPFAFFVLVVLPGLDDKNKKACPFCAELILRQATVAAPAAETCLPPKMWKRPRTKRAASDTSLHICSEAT